MTRGMKNTKLMLKKTKRKNTHKQIQKTIENLMKK